MFSAQPCLSDDAATGFQFTATVIVSLALVVVVTAAFASPPKTGLLGLALGIMLAVFSVFQMLAFSLMVAAVTEREGSRSLLASIRYVGAWFLRK